MTTPGDYWMTADSNPFYHGKLCRKDGHGTIRLTVNGNCHLCQLAATRAWKASQKAALLHEDELKGWRKIASEYRKEAFAKIPDQTPKTEKFNNTCFIYSLADPRTGQIHYVGKANDPKIRIYGHVDRRRILKKTPKNAWLQELLGKGLEPVLDILETTDAMFWQEREQKWIAAMRAAGAPLTNITSGGEGTVDHKHTAETKELIRAASLRMWSNPVFRARMSELLKNRLPSPATIEKRRQGNIRQYLSPSGKQRKEKLSKALQGHQVSLEMREKISNSLKARYASGLVHPMLGKSHSSDSRKKMSQSALRRDPATRQLSPEQKRARAEAISRAKKGWVPSAETRLKMRLAKLGRRRPATMPEKG